MCSASRPSGWRPVPASFETVEGHVEDRTLRATFSRTGIPLGAIDGIQPTEDATVVPPFDARGHLGVGEMGAAVAFATVLGVARRHGGDRLDEPTIRSLTRPDLGPDARGVCQRVSFGVGLGLVPVELVEAP